MLHWLHMHKNVAARPPQCDLATQENPGQMSLFRALDDRYRNGILGSWEHKPHYILLWWTVGYPAGVGRKTHMHIGIGYNKYSNFYFKEQQGSFMLRFMGLTGPAYLKSMLVTLSVWNSYSTFAPRSATLLWTVQS